jgi:hypothetical protein
MKKNPEDILYDCGFHNFDEETPLNWIYIALDHLGEEVRDSDRLFRCVVREAAIQCLKSLPKISAPAQMVDKALTQPEQSTNTGRKPFMNDPVPYEGPVDGAEIAKKIESILNLYLKLPEGAATTITVWIFHSYVFDAKHITPYLAACGPDKRCGKTTLLDLLSYLCHRAWPVSSATGAAIYRLVDEWHLTLLLDEADKVFRRNQAVKDIFISSHRKRFAFATVSVPDQTEGWKGDSFSTWSPKAYTSIGKPRDDQLVDRSIIIWMERRTEEETVAEWIDEEVADLLDPFRPKLLKWGEDNFDQIIKHRPGGLPSCLHDREKDNWRPLFCIADLLGGDWPSKAREAAVALSGRGEDESVLTLLLTDLREQYGERQSDFLKSTEICEYLNSMDERPWPEWRGKPITPTALAALLRRVKVKPKAEWVDGGHGNKKTTLRGYHRKDLEGAFERYIPHTLPDTNPQDLQESSQNKGFSTILNPQEETDPCRFESDGKPRKQGILAGLAGDTEDTWRDVP